MSKDVIEPKLAKLMNTVPECEGLIATDLEGKVIVSQTLTEMDHDAIAKTCAQIVKDSNLLGNAIGKGDSTSTSLELKEGYALIVAGKLILIALASEDGRASLSLLKRQLISISNS